MKAALFLFLSFVCLIAQEPEQEVSQETKPQVLATEAYKKVAIIPISDDGKYMVDDVQAKFVIKAIEDAEAQGVDAIILKIDTYGGVVFSARDIAEKLLRTEVKTIAYVETKAISAGTFIAWACQEIVMESKTTMGDAQMIRPTADGGIEVAPEKAVSVFRSDWKKSSSVNNRSFALAQAFFDVDVEVLQVGTEETFEFILRDEYELIPEKERKPLMKVISKKGQLLTFFAEEAAGLNIVNLATDFDSFLKERNYEMADETNMSMDRNQQVLRFLGANNWIFFLLVVIGLQGVYAEIKAPGLGIPGLTAVVCFTIVFGSRYLLGTATEIEILLFVAGILLCVIEIFVTPGVGIMGISGILLMFASLVLASLPEFGHFETPEMKWNAISEMSLLTMGSFVLSIVVMTLVFPFTLESRLAQKHMLATDMTVEEGFVFDTTEDDILGLEGMTPSGLRPSGKMKTDDGRFLDVVSDGSFIEKGSRVCIHQVDGNRIVVRRV